MSNAKSEKDPLIKDIQDERRWSRKVIGIQAYHSIQCAKFGTRRNHKWTLKDTARMLEMSIGSVSESLLLVNYLLRIPGLEFMTREDAIKRVKFEREGK